MTDWAALFRSLTADTMDSVDTLPLPAGTGVQTVKSVHCVRLSERKTEAAEALARDTIGRVKAGMAGYPADAVEAGEREAIAAEGRRDQFAPAGLTDEYLTGLRRAALLVRPPRFTAPVKWWSAGREGWCTGCGKPATWKADTPPAPSPSVLHWRCARCFPQQGQEDPAA